MQRQRGSVVIRRNKGFILDIMPIFACRFVWSSKYTGAHWQEVKFCPFPRTPMGRNFSPTSLRLLPSLRFVSLRHYFCALSNRWWLNPWCRRSAQFYGGGSLPSWIPTCSIGIINPFRWLHLETPGSYAPAKCENGLPSCCISTHFIFCERC